MFPTDRVESPACCGHPLFAGRSRRALRLERRGVTPLALVLLAGVLLLGVPGLAQVDPEGQAPGEDIVITVDKNQRPKVRLAFPAARKPLGVSPQMASAAAEIEATLRSDLRLSGVFTIQGPRELEGLQITGNLARDFEQYRSVGNEVALIVEIKVSDDSRLVLEGVLYDLPSKRDILPKRYIGGPELSRRIAHTFSDEIVLYMTGVRGIAMTSLAFTSDRDGDGVKELYLMDYDGYGQRRMTGHRSLSFSPAWSPSGEGLAYVSYYSGTGASIYWVDRATGDKSVILEEVAQALSPTVSPDGRYIAFAKSLRGNLEIFRIDRDGSNQRQLTRVGGIDTNPAWSPRGDRIAFTSSRLGMPQIYLMDAEGKNVRRLTFEGNYNDGASWSPDGRYIVFSARTRDGSRFNIAKLDVETGEQTMLTSGRGSHESPTFSPDGRFVAYESNRSGQRQIYLMTADGEEVAQLTNGSNNYGPSWSGYFDN